jgi:hypothetical protein
LNGEFLIFELKTKPQKPGVFRGGIV